MVLEGRPFTKLDASTRLLGWAYTLRAKLIGFTRTRPQSGRVCPGRRSLVGFNPAKLNERLAPVVSTRSAR